MDNRRLIDSTKLLERAKTGGTLTTYSELVEWIESGELAPDPIPPSIKPKQMKVIDQTTWGTDDDYQVGDIVQGIIDANPLYNKVYITKIMDDEWEIVGRQEVISHDK